MGRRRWRIVTIAAFLLFIIKDTQCQDDDAYYNTPVERSFAQYHPPIYKNTRPPSFYEDGDSFRVAQQPQQPLYDESRARFPSPNYNQNPSPFQLPTGRSQSGSQYYVNQPEFTPQRQRFRPAPPYNYQLVHPASTKRPDVPQIHSVAYQNDPSKPETFLGQITLNNPDIDYLQNTRFKNLPFDTNSLKINGQSGHISHDEDVIDNDNQDLYDQHRVTTYNPNKVTTKQRLNVKPTNSRFSHYHSPVEEKTEFRISASKIFANNIKDQKPKTNVYQSSSTEYKALLDIEPLLEDDISDISSFRELMKNKHSSDDVQVIKSNNSEDSGDDSESDDSKPDASSMNTDNYLKQIPVETPSTSSTTSTSTTTISSPIDDDLETENVEEDGEYVEYYDDPESSNTEHATKQPPSTHSTEHEDIYDEYDSTEETEKSENVSKSNATESFDVLVMKNGNTTVEDDNFKHFIDTTVIDQTEKNNSKDQDTPNVNASTAEDESTSIEVPSILGQEVVSVVTTKSVVNGTISIPDVTYAPSTTAKISADPEITSLKATDLSNETIPVTTESWIVVASVQTSRSVSGARFLPFPTVEQEEKKQVLVDEIEEDDSEEPVTKDPLQETSSLSASTENINDKLDSIQSELSSAVLSGSLDNGNKNIELITESTTESTTTSTTTTTTTTTTTALPNVFTLKSTLPPTFTERSSPEPLPVQIKKFSHRVTTSSTTPKPRKKLVTVMEDLSSGLLPPGYKPRLSYKDKRTSTTARSTTRKTTTTTTPTPTSSSEIPIINASQGRSSGINSKNKILVLDDKSLRPIEYRPKEHSPQEDLIKTLQKDDISKFLPPGYKATETPDTKATTKTNILDKAQSIDISALLPKNFTTEKPKEKNEILLKPISVDLSALLPPGFKLNTTETVKEDSEDILKQIKIADVSSLLPPGFKQNETDKETAQPSPTTTTKAPGMVKLVFPSRPGGKVNRKTTTPKPLGPAQVTPKIQKGWPTRASTEFTGWPSPSTTPFSIDKLLEAQRNATATSPMPEMSTEITTRRTTTTTTTVAPPPPTTPGVCKKECDIAATIKIVSGAMWVPELLDHHTDEWQRLAEDVKAELNSVYSKSDSLKKWYKGIRIDGFSKGSVLVDYFIELNEVEEKIDTLDLKKRFHKSLHEAKPGSVVEVVTEEPKEDDFDPDVMLGDQPDEDKMKKSNEKMQKTIDKSSGKLEMGKFIMDPAYTEFIVLPKREEPTLVVPDEESFLPQWGIAVIVIAMASLLFVIIFGVTVLVNRQKSAKAKQPIPLSEEMLRDLDKSHMGGFDDMQHNLKERDLPYLPSGKRMSTAFIEQLAYPNPGDSWRSEWTPQLQKYMQHYTPDSGRGSQYGAAYGYGGSQLYGHTGGGSQVYGYTGEYPAPRSHYSRRRSEYDSNF